MTPLFSSHGERDFRFRCGRLRNVGTILEHTRSSRRSRYVLKTHSSLESSLHACCRRSSVLEGIPEREYSLKVVRAGYLVCLAVNVSPLCTREVIHILARRPPPSYSSSSVSPAARMYVSLHERCPLNAVRTGYVPCLSRG